MLFNSIDFSIFLPIFFIIYWSVQTKSLQFQNLVIVIASYFFYACWDWRFLFLIFFSTIVDYFIGIQLIRENNPVRRKLLLWVSIGVNLGFLAYFKYFNFFIENFSAAFSFFGAKINANTLTIILPVGISFYTFQTLSYTIDVYKNKINATKDFIAFSAFVSFFPQLVAGPIERASNLLPQFYVKRYFDYAHAVNGMKQILWGLLKKMVIADNCAQFANQIFNNASEMNGSALMLGAIFFSFQIYGDFSGYSDIAIGTSRLLGFKLSKNFAFPYFSRDIAEFWRRWHISLSTWFRDYLYIPLGGSKVGGALKIRNIILIFVISGLWHGANWTFIIWGALHACYYLPLVVFKKNRIHIDAVASKKLMPSFSEVLGIMLTFGLTAFAWIFFRAENVSHAMTYISGLFSTSIVELPNLKNFPEALVLLMLISCFQSVEWVGRANEFAIEKIGSNRNRAFRWGFYSFILFIIGMFMQTEETPFIYFQF